MRGTIMRGKMRSVSETEYECEYSECMCVFQEYGYTCM